MFTVLWPGGVQRIGVVKVSRKASLLSASAAGALPSAIGDVRESALLQGYIASLTADAAYVRYRNQQPSLLPL